MAKNIVLCSDGTGKKGGDGHDTNVYSLYRHVDIHNEKHPQLTFYDNGVGTNVDGESLKQNKIWRAVSGAFGFGFENNVRNLYEFLATHYEFGDRIFLFGYSRGASTVRALTGMLHTCGLISLRNARGEKKERRQFQQEIDLALMAYRQRTRNAGVAVEFKRKHAITHPAHAPGGNIKVHFIGVWDTVSALGFPKDGSVLFDRFFTWVDKVSDYRWPHHYYNFGLHDEIQFACQALALDDERNTFFPRLWREQKRVQGSVEQVWFAGSHGNVGGGMPRTGLSNVALQWMMQRAQSKGLVFTSDSLKDVSDYANAQGKLYDSRDGLAVYYRYQPRDIQAICQERVQGKIKIHHSVIERFEMGTAAYLPVYFPAEFAIVNQDNETASEFNASSPNWQSNREETGKTVKKKQRLYRFFVETTMVMLAVIIGFWLNPPDVVTEFLQQGNTETVFFVFRWIYQLLTYILPVLFENFLTYILCLHPWIFILMIATLYAIYRLSKTINIELNHKLEQKRVLLQTTLDKLK